MRGGRANDRGHHHQPDGSAAGDDDGDPSQHALQGEVSERSKLNMALLHHPLLN